MGKSDQVREENLEDLKELVIARIEVRPGNKKTFIGGPDGGEFSKEDLIEHVRRGDSIGRKVIEIEMTFLKALKDGSLLNQILMS